MSKRSPPSSDTDSPYKSSEPNTPCKKPKGDLICLVCGDHALGKNFSVISCESCKAFFRRHADLMDKLICTRGGQCAVDAWNRNNCKKCRIFKCFSVGMDTTKIESDAQKTKRKERLADRKRRAEVKEEFPDASIDEVINSVVAQSAQYSSTNPVTNPITNPITNDQQAQQILGQILTALTGPLAIPDPSQPSTSTAQVPPTLTTQPSRVAQNLRAILDAQFGLRDPTPETERIMEEMAKKIESKSKPCPCTCSCGKYQPDIPIEQQIRRE